ncbi:MAG: ABC transporter permease [Ruminococcaceae bacterium]|nr:ABC transporter permease [Oscillospiraceae bacterium]
MEILKALGKMPLYKKLCLVILAAYLLIAIFAPQIMPYEVDDFSHDSLLTPSSQYLLGTDEMGHDIFSLLINGFRITVVLALISGALSTILGTFLAFCAAYFGKVVNDAITALANIFIIVPEIVVIMFVAVIAEPTMTNTVLAIVFFSWARVFKIVRGKLLDSMSKNKVKYTMLMKGNVFDVCRKLVPDVAPTFISFFVLQCNRAVTYETTLSFFGVGDPLSKTWGKLIRAAMDYEELYYDNVFLWYLVPVILVVLVFVVCLALLVSEED